MKPICFHCQRFYRPSKNGIWFLEGMPKGKEAAPGTRDPAAWKPYKLWHGDLWYCPDCGHEVISGVGHEPYSVQHELDFKQKIAVVKPIVQINDC